MVGECYKYFTKNNIWPRGFALENIQDNLPKLKNLQMLNCPIQQGLADENPDIDAIYRLTLPLPFTLINMKALHWVRIHGAHSIVRIQPGLKKHFPYSTCHLIAVLG